MIPIADTFKHEAAIMSPLEGFGFMVERFGRDIDVARPDHRAVINLCHGKQRSSFQPHKWTFFHIGCHIKNPLFAILELKVEQVIRCCFYVYDVQ